MPCRSSGRPRRGRSASRDARGRARAPDRRPRARATRTARRRRPSSARARRLLSTPNSTSPSRVPGGEQRSRHDLARVACLEDPQRQAALRLERLLHVLRDRERVVRHQHDVGRLSSSPPHPATASATPSASATERLVTLCHLALPGRIARRTPCSTAMRARRVREDVGDAAARPRLERLSSQRVDEAFGSHIFGRAVDGEERDELAGRALEDALAADDVDARLAEEAHRPAQRAYRSEARRSGVDSRWSSRPPPTPARGCGSGSSRPRRRARARDRSRPSRAGCRSMRTPGCLCHRDRLGRGGVEVADCDGDLEPERQRVLETLVRRDDGGTERHRERARGAGGSPPATTTTISSDTPSSAGITQIRFCGSAALRAALSARLPELPVTSLNRVLPRVLTSQAVRVELAPVPLTWAPER